MNAIANNSFFAGMYQCAETKEVGMCKNNFSSSLSKRQRSEFGKHFENQHGGGGAYLEVLTCTGHPQQTFEVLQCTAHCEDNFVCEVNEPDVNNQTVGNPRSLAEYCSFFAVADALIQDHQNVDVPYQCT
jgi:hypothetical protein